MSSTLFPSKAVLFFSLLVSGLLLSACGGETETVPAEEQAAAEQAYEVRGFFMETDEANQIISILHEEIPDVMRAMRMRMILEDQEGAEGLERGDMISFTMVRIGNSWYVRNITQLPEDTELDIPENLLEML